MWTLLYLITAAPLSHHICPQYEQLSQQILEYASDDFEIVTDYTKTSANYTDETVDVEDDFVSINPINHEISQDIPIYTIKSITDEFILSKQVWDVKMKHYRENPKSKHDYSTRLTTCTQFIMYANKVLDLLKSL